MSLITTRLTKLLGIKHPIVLAPMAGAAGANLASAVSGAGGFGFIGGGRLTVEQLDTHLTAVRSTLQLPKGEQLPVGVGFITWALEKDNLGDAPDPRISAVLRHDVRAVWLAFGGDTGKYVRQVRVEAPKALVFVMVSTVEEALKATNEWKADVLVVQGEEAGGHGGGSAIPLSVILTAVLRAIPKDGPVVIAAGGIMTGPQVASALVLGASGTVVGTRFLLTPESDYAQEKKSIIARAKLGSTLKAVVFDEMNGFVWPYGCDGRAVANKIVDDAKAGLSLEERLALVAENKGGGREIVWAGAGSGLVSTITPAKDVVQELIEDATASLKVASNLLTPESHSKF
ncbi:2-nitropropane dioxygenase [Cylindrobasidium torrendii FP15055 ss-10]|uniref:2-nitropropane dioxygenase n=1 Tax=Cylindrobasidium torrendii FP15055 ss-10 TaxID=1314674 RepID=A0A0D7B6E9_9AGAR|nr:2-nitropropane dioxygenase [Cylindrobasidium torrendii FP15055 ss-10]